ncbi:MAG: restriction endonuclease [Armatimonadetes bacterium]|nr:restriction endonuclease [Armatimonadota bacterium]
MADAERELHEKLLTELYNSHGYQPSFFDYGEFAEKLGLKKEGLDRVFSDLKYEGLVEASALGRAVQLTAKGALFVEQHGLADSALIAENREARIEFLGNLADMCAEDGPEAFYHWETVANRGTTNRAALDRNLLLMSGADVIDFVSMQTVQLTRHGLSYITRVREERSIKSEFETLKGGALTPQARGHALEVLMERACNLHGVDVERNVKADNEENDLIIQYDTHHFIVSCKWEKKPVGMPAVTDLFYRVSIRPHSYGIIASMSGFAGTVEVGARESMGQAIMLLFGPTDIERWLEGEILDAVLQKLDHVAKRKQFRWN